MPLIDSVKPAIEKRDDSVDNRPAWMNWREDQYTLWQAKYCYDNGFWDAEHLINWLMSNGYSQDSDGNFTKDDRSNFLQFVHDKFGPALAKIAGTIVTLGAVNEITNKDNSGTSFGNGVTVESATGNDILNQNSGLSQVIGNVWDGIKKYGSDMLSGLSQVGSGIIGQLGSSWLNMKNMEHLIDKQNEYNTPAAQMERFRDAGLNENLIYGLGTNGNSPQAGSIAPVDFDTSQRESRLAKMQIETQLKQTDADVAQKQSVVNLNEKQGALVDEERKQKALENSVWLENFQAELNTKLQTIENLIAEQENIRANTHNKLIENQYADSIWRLKKQASELQNQIATIQKNWQPFLNAGEIFSDVVGSFRDFGIGFGGLKSVFGNRQSQPVRGSH